MYGGLNKCRGGELLDTEGMMSTSLGDPGATLTSRAFKIGGRAPSNCSKDDNN
jgi:hypothetical protein